MTLRTINSQLPDNEDYKEETHHLRALSLTSPFAEGIRHCSEAIFCHRPKEQSPSLLGRALHLVAGVLLLTPIINIIIFLALRALRPPIECSLDPEAKNWPQELRKALHFIENDPKDYDKMFKVILDNGQKYWHLPPDSNGGNILHFLAKLDALSQEHISHVIKSGVDLSLRDDVYGNTPLHWAIANAANTSALTIIESTDKNDYLNVQCKAFQNTALHLSVGKGYVNKSVDGKTLTHSNIEITRAILMKKANPNLRNEMGNTPLHLACLRRDPHSIQALIKAGADPKILNENKLSPKDLLDTDYEIAVQILKDTVCEFLLDKGKHRSNFDAASAALG